MKGQAFLFFVVLSAVSRADTVSYSSAANMNINGTGSYTTTSFTPGIPQFDPSLGTLTSVSIAFDTRISTTFQGTYTSTSGSRTLALSSVDTLTFVGQTISFNGNDSKTRTFTNGAFYSIPFSYGGGRSTLAPSLTPFIGTGSLGTASWRSNVSFTGLGFFSFPSLTGSTSGTIKVTYVYTP